ncbi:glycoside hydrolase [Paenibacillus sp. CAA11]|uniref:glycoside hydrolase family 32 protein n=1 Tax=Paenibacillus sp. CAA11 TaxID=1532905 RepID=UPI000D3D99C7|nr:glycoside hydrolase family 32 protein [Paenibacillus sp. CAA11]AWB45920.1 glycoside hydrolase [Paenibacillus sp. CAA11]
MKIMKHEKHRPLWHFSPKQHWINDPNGLVYFNQEYHLFFQHHPSSSNWGPMHWGHAVSRNLIDWEELPIALAPDELGTIFSGSAVVDWKNTTGFFPEEPGLVAIFTHHLDTGEEGVPITQAQSLAYSTDQGRTWTKYEGNPVLSCKSNPDFRDPKVFWHPESARWVMVLATGQTISIYSSPDLKSWTFESEFGEGIGFHGAVWECPDLFQLNIEGTSESRWVLLVSVGDNPEFDEGSRTQYFIGSFDGSKFTPDDAEIRWLDYGRDNYAGVSFSDIPEEDGRRLYIAWMSNWRYARQVPTNGWRGVMTFPRALTLVQLEDATLIRQQPAEELKSYFSERTMLPDLTIAGGVSHSFPCQAEALELNLNLEHADAAGFDLILQHTADQHTKISYCAVQQTLTLYRDQSGIRDFAEIFPLPQAMPVPLPDNIRLQILVDTSSIEVFVNDGLYALTSVVYPDQTCEQITIHAKQGDVRVYDSSLAVR